MNIAIIPARSGSKRIKNKNITKFYGKPLIFYTIKTAIKSKLFDKIIVSTDSKIISKLSKKYGASIPFMRPKHLSNDHASTMNVINHAVKWLSKKNESAKFYCCIYPTTPLLSSTVLKDSFKKIRSMKYDYVLSVMRYSHPIERSFKIDKFNKIKTLNDKNLSFKTQNFKSSYFDAGQFYWGTEKSWIRRKKIFSKSSYAYILPTLSAHDIDTYEDLKINKLLFKLKGK